jgi:predicted PurR-regulated permease PerM
MEGVLVVGQLFGFVGLFVAIPILAAIVIGVDELWVKPTEARAGIETPDAGGSVVVPKLAQ